MPSSSRRQFLRTGAAAIASTPLLAADPKLATAARLASGVKAGEVTDNSAIIWARLTKASTRNAGLKVTGRPAKKEAPKIDDLAKLEGACPGAPGLIRVRYTTSPDPSKFVLTDWAKVDETTDFVHQFHLKDLPADTLVNYSVETADTGKEGTPHGAFAGSFRTAPSPAKAEEILFGVITCQMYMDLDDPNGFHIYSAMQKQPLRFVAVMGDDVYYDSELPVATSPALARYHWERMYSLQRHVNLYRSVASYWAKDDHDTVRNDCWPGQKAGTLTFEEGQKIFRQQAPMGESIYRTFRWGKDLQIWITDGRDFRSPNNMKDGPEKTIWGKEQKAWLFRTIKESDATWKVLISPTPIVGPDRGNKGDNHANLAFKHEGDEARAWFKANVPNNFFTMCGDRHWQFHSVHPETGLNEFSVGAASDEHAGGSPGEDPKYHKFHRVKGGYVTVAVKGKSITFRHHDVHGKVVYEKAFNA